MIDSKVSCDYCGALMREGANTCSRCGFYQPSEQYIEEATARIRMGWSNREHLSRAGITQEKRVETKIATFVTNGRVDRREYRD